MHVLGMCVYVCLYVSLCEWVPIDTPLCTLVHTDMYLLLPVIVSWRKACTHAHMSVCKLPIWLPSPSLSWTRSSNSLGVYTYLKAYSDYSHLQLRPRP